VPNRAASPQSSLKEGKVWEWKKALSKVSWKLGIAIRCPEGQFIIHLEKIGYAQLLPGTDQCLCDAPIVFAMRAINRNPMGSYIHYVEAVEPGISSDVVRPHDICLVHIVDAEGLWLGAGRPLRDIRQLFSLQALSAQDVLDGRCRQRGQALEVEFPINGVDANLRVLGVLKFPSNFDHHFLHLDGSSVMSPFWTGDLAELLFAPEPLIEPFPTLTQRTTDASC